MSKTDRAGHQRVNGPAHVRFYVDADVLGLAKLLVQVRNDVTFPGDPGGVLHKRQRSACPITSPGVLDPVWIPEVTRHGWLIVTRDRNIAVNRAEIAAVRDSGARMVTLASKEAIRHVASAGDLHVAVAPHRSAASRPRPVHLLGD